MCGQQQLLLMLKKQQTVLKILPSSCAAKSLHTVVLKFYSNLIDNKRLHILNIMLEIQYTVWLFNLGLLLYMVGHVSCFTTHNIIMCVLESFFIGSLFVSYWLPGNEGPPHVINGHNYVIEEWSASCCK